MTLQAADPDIHMCDNPLNSQCAVWRPEGRRGAVRAVTWLVARLLRNDGQMQINN